MIEELTLRAVLGFLKRYWYCLPIIGLSIALAIVCHNLGNARDKLATEAQTRDALAGVLHGLHSDGPYLLYLAGERMKESENRRAALATISNQAQAAKQRSDAADKKLAETQAENAKKYAAAQRTISELEHRKPTGDPVKDCAAIEEDSKAAWKGWRK